nr:EF hand calcium binding domain containing protein [Hymenolepis microstoma]
MNSKNTIQNTSGKILKGAILSQCFISKGYDTDDEIMKLKALLHTDELQDRLQSEELFLTNLLSEVREDHISREADFEKLSNSLQQHFSTDPLPYQWLHNCTLSTKVRMYLAEELLPTVVLGLEHILSEAYRRGLCKFSNSETSGEDVEVRADVNFNPLNRLAEFLMRNNPKYSNKVVNTSRYPYTKAMRQVVDRLKRELFLRSGSDLAKCTIESENIKHEWETIKQQKNQEYATKWRLTEPIFDFFRLEGKDTVNSMIVQQSVRAFMLIVMKMPYDLSLIQRPIIHVENVEENIENYTLHEFMTYVAFYVKPLSMETFQTFVNHMQKCGKEYQNQVNLAIKLDHIAEVSVSCDMETAGIDKQQLYEEFNRFAEEADAEMQRNLVHPHDWHIQEYHLRNEVSATRIEAVEEVLGESFNQIENVQLSTSEVAPINPNDNMTSNDDNAA